jgi:hypothetical protein
VLTPSLLTPDRLIRMLRPAAAVCALGLAVLMLGPFHGVERVFGLTDGPAHAIAFFWIATGLFAIAPEWRRGDIALAALLIAVLSETLQGLTGRSLSLLELAADAVGIVVAMIPGWVERLRSLARSHPDATFAEIRAMDRRGRPEDVTALDVTALVRSPAIRHRRKRKDRR